MAYTFDFPLNRNKIKGNIIFLSRIPSSTINRILNFFINPLRIPKKYDVYHIMTQTLGRLSMFIHPSIITVHDIYPLKASLTEPTMYGDLKSLPYGNKLISAAYHTFVRESIKSVKYADVIITPSDYTKKELISLLQINSQKIKVVPHGIRHDLFKPRDKIKTRKILDLPLNKKIVLHVGSENPRKNIPTLIKAFAKLQKDGYRNTILLRVGETQTNTHKLISTLHLDESVLEFGLRDQSELCYLYNAADVLVFPSLYEGFGLPVIEAMASGCPVIAADRTSLPEVLGDAGILCDPLNINELAEAMKMFLGDEELRQKCSQKGLKRAAMYSWERVVKETVKIFKESTKLF
jgi:glycosyltransferase involved in cell wall biosynthesis